MAKKKPPEQGRSALGRENLKYVGLPIDLYEALEKFAADNSDEDDHKSISWAARVAVRRFLAAEGRWPPPAKP